MPTEANLKILITANASQAIAQIRATQSAVLTATKTGQDAANKVGTESAAKGIQARQALLTAQRDWEYRQGIASAEQLKARLATELGEYEEFSGKWMAISKRIAKVDAEQRAGASPQQKNRSAAIGKVGEGLMIGGAVGLGVMAYAGDQAAKFDASMTQMRNNTQMTDAQFQQMKSTVQGLGQSLGANMDEIGAAYVRVANHGYQAGDAMNVVTEATRSAVATGSSVETTANLLAQTMHMWHLGADQAKVTMNVLHQTALMGNMSMQQFVDSAGPAYAIAANLGVSLQDVSAAFAAITQNGFSADQAATQLKGIFTHIISPSKSAREELEKLHKSTGIDLPADFSLAGLRAKGLSGIMDDLRRATTGHEDKILKLIPAQRGTIGAMILAGKGARDLRDDYGTLGQIISGQLDPTTQGLTRTQTTLKNQVDRLNNSLTVLYTKVGPGVVGVLSGIVKEGQGLVDWFNKLNPETQTAIGLFVSVASGIALAGGAAIKAVQGFAALKAAMVAMGLAEGATVAETVAAFAAGGPIVLAIGATIGAVVMLALKWKEVEDAQDQATASVNRYQNALAQSEAAGGLQGLVARQQDIQQGKGGIENTQRAIDGLKRQIAFSGMNPLQQAADIYHHPEDMNIPVGDDKYTAGLRTQLAQHEARLKQLQADLATTNAQIKSARTGGAGAADRNLMAAGGDGFAKSVIGHVFDQINTPNNVASCALYVSEVFKRAGAPIPGGGIAGAKSLVDWAIKHGATAHPASQALPGDLIAFHGPRFGANGSMYHVGVGLGGGMVRQSSRGVVSTQSIAGELKWGGPGSSAMAYTIPGSTWHGSASTPGVLPPAAWKNVPTADPKAAAAAAADAHKAAQTQAAGALEAAQKQLGIMLDTYKSGGADMTSAQRDALKGRIVNQIGLVDRLQEAHASTLGDSKHPAQAAAERKKAMQEAADAKIANAKRLAAVVTAVNDQIQKKQDEADRKRLESLKKVQEFELHGLEIQQRGAEGDARKADLAKQIAAVKGKIADLDQKIALKESDPDALGAALDYKAALADINDELAQQNKELTDSARQKALDDMDTHAKYMMDLRAANGLAGQDTPEGQSARISGIGGTVTTGPGGILQIHPSAGPAHPHTDAGGALDAEDQGIRAPDASETTWNSYKQKMTGEVTAAMDAAGPKAIEGLFGSSKQRAGAMKSFWGDMVSLGKQELAQMFYDRVLKRAFNSVFDGLADGVMKAMKSGGSGLLADVGKAAGIMMSVYNLSGAAGKKKQKHSFFGAALGFVAGSLLPGIGNLEGAELGASLGGMFANGGNPPIGVPSLVGERGPELFVPSVPGTIIPNHRLVNADMGGTNINVSMLHTGDINNAEAADAYHNRLANVLKNAVRGRT